MEPSTPGGVIPMHRLTKFDVFTDLEQKGEEILKTAKLAHVNNLEGFVVTTADETYSFSNDDLLSSVATITRIPELCGVQVKGNDCNYFMYFIFKKYDNFFDFSTFQNFLLDQLTSQ